MRRALPPLALAAALLAPATSSAACFADYKAKQDQPLRLHYGVVEVPDAACDARSAAGIVQGRLRDGWQLLQVISVFGPEGLDQRKASAGDYFLRY